MSTATLESFATCRFAVPPDPVLPHPRADHHGRQRTGARHQRGSGDTTALLDRHPGPDEVGLLVEIADASLDRDRGWKKRIYAAAEVPVYWIVNLVDRQVEVFLGPSGPGDAPDYGTRQVFLPGDQVPVVLDGNQVGRIAVGDLLP